MQGHPLRAYDFLRGLRKSHFHCGSGTFDFLVVLVRPKENQGVLEKCYGKCYVKSRVCYGKIGVLWECSDAPDSKRSCFL